MIRLLAICLLANACTAAPTVIPTQASSAPSAATEQSTAEAAAAEASEEETETVAETPGVGRDQAIAQLSEVAFLSYGDSSCVIDALYEEIGSYDFNSAMATGQADVSDLTRTCTDDDVPVADEPVPEVEASTEDGAEEAEAEVDNSADEPSSSSSEDDTEAPPVDATAETATDAPEASDDGTESADDASDTTSAVAPAQPAVLAPGGITTGTVEINGEDVGYAVITPAQFQPGDSAPVLIALHEDRASVTATRDMTQDFFGSAAAAQGWVVVSPALPDRDWTDPRNAAVVLGFTEWIRTWVQVEGGKPHLGGAYGGGAGAFAIAAQNPSAFQSLMAYPGLPPDPLAPAASSLASIPIRLWVVDVETSRWVVPLGEAETVIRAAGGDIALRKVDLERDLNLLSFEAFGQMVINELQTLR